MSARFRLTPVVLALLAISSQAGAHRADEYLQASLLTIGTDRVDVEIQLTAGISMAAQVFGWIDTDQDGQISNPEGKEYAESMLRSLILKVDDRPVPLRILEASFPQFEEMRLGLGTIRLRAAGRIPATRRGLHQISFLNTHKPESSVYLVNALIPTNPLVRLSQPQRDFGQRKMTLEYTVASDASAPRSVMVRGIGIIAFGLFLRLCYAIFYSVQHRQRRIA